MKLLSYNVALFEKNNLPLSEFIQSQNPDILCLQEVTKKIDESAHDDFISKDSIDAASDTCRNFFYAPTWVLSHFKKMNFHGHDHFSFDLGGKVEFGNYLRTKFKITKGENVFVQNHFTYVTDWSNWPEDDCKAVQVIDLQIKGKPLRILNYHGIWSKDKKGTPKTLRACEKIRDLALSVDYPSIICGDFNLFPNTESMQVLNDSFESLGDTYSIKSTRPSSNELNDTERNVVDFIFISKGIIVKNFEVIDTPVSDHLPLLLEFEL